MTESNKVTLVGENIDKFQFSHEIFGEKFYTAQLAVNRFSNYVDCIPVMVSERLIDVEADYSRKSVLVTGRFSSYNSHHGNKHQTILFVFAKEFMVLQDDVEHENQIFLDGYICKAPVYRKTPLGREIADVLLAVNRSYGKSDYIPCICWGRNARFASGFEVGSHIQILGRIQSREYVKRINEEETEHMIAYEVSMYQMEVIDE